MMEVYSTLGITRQDESGITLYSGLRTKSGAANRKAKDEPDIFASLSCPVSHEQMEELVTKWFKELSPLAQQQVYAKLKRSAGEL